MASIHVNKPIEQKQQCPDTCKNKTNIEHQSFTNKMKGMTDKMFHQNKAPPQQHGTHVPKTGLFGMTDKLFNHNKVQQQHGTNAPKTETGLLGMTDKLFNHNKVQQQNGTNAPKTGLLGMTDKLFHHNKAQQNGIHAGKTGYTPGPGLYNDGTNKIDKKKIGTKKEGNCIPKMNERKKKSKSEGNRPDNSDSDYDK